jgi:hypothetical protein
MLSTARTTAAVCLLLSNCVHPLRTDYASIDIVANQDLQCDIQAKPDPWENECKTCMLSGHALNFRMAKFAVKNRSRIVLALTNLLLPEKTFSRSAQ